MERLPPHIIEEQILLCLPLKTLFRFKCVCKRWLSFIESRSFINRHYSRERDDDRLVLRHYVTYKSASLPLYSRERLTEVDPNQRFPHSEYIVELIGPQLGLFCQVDLNGDIILFNPSTKMLKGVPPFDSYIPPPDQIYGFGLDPLTRDYKIIAFCQPLREPTTFLFIYNSTSDSWKEEEASRLDSMNGALASKSKAFLDGVYYWMTLTWPRRRPLDRGNKNRVILAFDMRMERFREIQLPQPLAQLEIEFFVRPPHYIVDPEYLVQISTQGDLLALFSFHFEWVDIWVMGEEGVWNRSLRVGPLELGLHLKPLSMWENKLVLRSHLLRDRLILIDVSTHDRRNVAIPIFPRMASDMHSALFYRDSLVSTEGESSYGN